MNSCPGYFFSNIHEAGSNFTLIYFSYAVYKMTRYLDILFLGKEYENDLSTEYQRMDSLSHSEASFLNFQC